MIKINKNKEPDEWTEYKNTPGADYKAIPELVESLLDEQGYICAYCMRRIPCRDRIHGKGGMESLTSEDHRIEHIKSREKHEDLKLDYGNMVICCPGHIGSEEHCDRLKGDRDISFSPLDQNFIDTLSYSTDGEIHSSNKIYDDEINNVLNLNTYLLKKNRKETRDTVIGELNRLRNKRGGWDKKLLERVLDKYSSKHHYDDGDKFYPYCGVVTWYIKKKIAAVH